MYLENIFKVRFFNEFYNDLLLVHLSAKLIVYECSTPFGELISICDSLLIVGPLFIENCCPSTMVSNL